VIEITLRERGRFRQYQRHRGGLAGKPPSFRPGSIAFEPRPGLTMEFVGSVTQPGAGNCV
jgi:hypothetical protein